jgi:hypothetical protein
VLCAAAIFPVFFICNSVMIYLLYHGGMANCCHGNSYRRVHVEPFLLVDNVLLCYCIILLLSGLLEHECVLFFLLCARILVIGLLGMLNSRTKQACSREFLMPSKSFLANVQDKKGLIYLDSTFRFLAAYNLIAKH